MRKTLLYLSLLIGAIFLGLFIIQVPSFVLFQIKDLSIALPLWLFILIFTVFIYALFIVRKIMRSLFILPQKLKTNLAKMQQRQNVRKQLKKIKKQIERTKI